MTAVVILLVWVFPVIFGGIVGIQHNRTWTGILWPLFIGWLGFLIAFYIICGTRRPPRKPPMRPEDHPGYVAGLKDGEL